MAAEGDMIYIRCENIIVYTSKIGMRSNLQIDVYARFALKEQF